VVLGTAQDGGLPQVGCTRPCCAQARRDPSRARLVTALLVVDARSGRRWLLDCPPALEPAVARADAAAPPPGRPGRPPLFDGIFLTHGHAGHCAGLLQLGREAYAAERQPVWATERMERFLLGNDPFAFLVEAGHVELHRLVPGEGVQLAPDLALEAVEVPHRGEFSDTVAFVVRGPQRALLYAPDTDRFGGWDPPVEQLLAGVDGALLDGTFFAAGEVPGRSQAVIPHPLVEQSLERFAPLPAGERAKILFTHLNHTNPAADPKSTEARRVRDAGMGVAAEGQVIGL
jgi:pyrroloquinoline quinone biosynthesis protein B